MRIISSTCLYENFALNKENIYDNILINLKKGFYSIITFSEKCLFSYNALDLESLSLYKRNKSYFKIKYSGNIDYNYNAETIRNSLVLMLDNKSFKCLI